MRIDKILSNLFEISRKDIKKYEKNIFLNGVLVDKLDKKVNFGDEINFLGQKFIWQENIFLILNKPSNFVSSKIDEANYKSAYELLQNCVYKNILQIVGRLDVDTTGLLLFTNNGEIIHKLISPKKNIFKKYRVIAKNPLNLEDLEKLKSGVIIDENYLTKKAKVEQISKNEIYLSITEGKFHQIKKMLASLGNEVVALERIEIGEIKLGDLKLGEWRYLSEKEINFLFSL